MGSERESSVQKKLSNLPSISNVMTLESETTIGRTFRLCGAIGVITKFSEVGIIIGPPQLNEYPVEPVGVEIINPSAR